MGPKSENLSSSHFSNNRALRGRSAMNFCGIKWTLIYQDVGSPEAGPGKWKASWQPSGALAGGGG